ncbi:ribosome hibernation-promoting factor, HPF/YfiA family [Rhodoplanes sp. Z2-YC6860]|uniref:ribosome hibernation-promoting factor, HPF/YfiA family n=1 Tax=Rhodoplanes sp. Z2-YC6860 TaxID=674703 RepID=UPI00078BB67B|nr:ribosome-associated translation inhibitor RaiA [Rhodoplanes sp. Z2-YC6860]AMN38840.1 ribosomal subunit interface protein [Rhodoplanes sp. Z2-YC6860]
MPFRVSGKNIEVGEALRERISARVLEALEKYFDGGFSGHVTVGKEAFGFQTECVVHLDSGIVLRADSMAADAYLSADQAAEKLEKRLRRYHSRLKDYHGNGRSNGAVLDETALTASDYTIAAPGQEDSDDVATFNPVIIAEQTTSLKQLSVSEAVTHLDMTGAPVMVFRHASHGRVNMVYRRADGNIGWIDPPAVPAGGH